MRPIHLAFAALFIALPAAAQPASPVVKREFGSLISENVPETPPAVREALRRYQNARSAAFVDWLADGSMLISTRFGQTAQLHRVGAPGPSGPAARRQLTFYDEPIGSAEAVPGSDNRYIFLRDTGGDEYFQAYLTGLSGAPVAVTEPKTRNEDLVVSRDGRLAAWSKVTPGSGDYDIQVMNPADPASRRTVLKGKGAIGPVDIAPDGRSLIALQQISATKSKLYRLDIASAVLAELNPKPIDIAYGRARFLPGRNAILLISDEGSDFARLVEMDLATGRRTPVSPPDLPWDVQDFDLSPDGRTLAYAVNEDGMGRVALAEVGSRRLLPGPKLPLGVVGALKFSPDGQRLAVNLSTPTSPGDVWAYHLRSGVLERWTESEAGGLDPRALVTPNLVRFKSFDGASVPTFLYKPTRPHGRLPVIIDIHGGPEGQTTPGFNPTAQYWVNQLGIAVLTPNVRGSSGYGKTYLSADNGLNRLIAVKDIGALLDWIGAQPDLDPKRVVVYGGSYGGYMSLATFAAYNERLAGAIDIVGISNFTTFLTNTEGYRRDLRRVEYGDEREPKMRAFFDQISPLNQVERMKKPLFVIAGRNDPRVPWTEGQQVVAKVRANGQEVWWMMAKDEGHGFRKKQNRDAQREAETLFLQKVLGLGALAP